MRRTNLRRILISRFLIAVIATVGLDSFAVTSKFHTPPLEVTFSAANVGSTTEIEVRIDKEDEYILGVGFFIKNTPEEDRRVGAILGAPRQIGPGQWIEQGVPAKFRVRIHLQPGEKEVLVETVDHPKTRPGYIGRTADIVRIKMKPGRYSIRLDYIEGMPELAGLPAKLTFKKSHHGK